MAYCNYCGLTTDTIDDDCTTCGLSKTNHNMNKSTYGHLLLTDEGPLGIPKKTIRFLKTA